ncbi:hypothetical protein LEP48_08405 [Isoptericola sp. NEAU-Y5]|uniref:Transmembrane protein n=1 Tax=Isoptericola luteus TaxID=2879484 RepID=A0ABS7ZEB6_9MICO|nr:hypothetical protein [Isoptericola sp. NEAU-Y5]MCA5893372.1 hypothetical protein [Isoptericola sp. NEAU-Y5]
MASTTSAPATRKRVLHPGSPGMLVGGLLIVVGSLLPWIFVAGLTMSGSLPLKLWLLSSGCLAVAGALVPRRWFAIVHCALAGLTAGVLVAWQLALLIRISATTDAWGAALPSIGLVMVGGGAVVTLATAVRLVRAPGQPHP